MLLFLFGFKAAGCLQKSFMLYQPTFYKRYFL